MFKRWGLHPADVVLFVFFGLIYAVFGAIWSVNALPFSPNNINYTLQAKKDIMYYMLWGCAVGYALLANSAILWNKAPRSGILAFPVILVLMGGFFAVMTWLTAELREFIAPSVRILSIPIGDLLVLLPVVTATIIFMIAWLGTGIFNHQREQPLAQGFIRLGMALMSFPLIQFLVIFFLPRWDDEVRGVVFIHAMGLGLMWGVFLGGALGSNLRRRRTNGETATA